MSSFSFETQDSFPADGLKSVLGGEYYNDDENNWCGVTGSYGSLELPELFTPHDDAQSHYYRLLVQRGERLEDRMAQADTPEGRFPRHLLELYANSPAPLWSSPETSPPAPPLTSSAKLLCNLPSLNKCLGLASAAFITPLFTLHCIIPLFFVSAPLQSTEGLSAWEAWPIRRDKKSRRAHLAAYGLSFLLGAGISLYTRTEPLLESCFINSYIIRLIDPLPHP